MRFGIYFLRIPVKFGVWYIRISTLSGPNSDTSGASKEAHDGFGDSLVPLNASVRTLTFNVGVARRAFWSVEIWVMSIGDQCFKYGIVTSSCSVFPIYKVDKNMCLSAFNILV